MQDQKNKKINWTDSQVIQILKLSNLNFKVTVIPMLKKNKFSRKNSNSEEFNQRTRICM